jgi:hypothetical protein
MIAPDHLREITAILSAMKKSQHENCHSGMDCRYPVQQDAFGSFMSPGFQQSADEAEEGGLWPKRLQLQADA